MPIIKPKKEYDPNKELRSIIKVYDDIMERTSLIELHDVTVHVDYKLVTAISKLPYLFTKYTSIKEVIYGNMDAIEQRLSRNIHDRDICLFLAGKRLRHLQFIYRKPSGGQKSDYLKLNIIVYIPTCNLYVNLDEDIIFLSNVIRDVCQTKLTSLQIGSLTLFIETMYRKQ